MDPRDCGGGVDELVRSMPSSIASYTINPIREFSTEPFPSSPSSSPRINPDRTQLTSGTGNGVGNGRVSSSTVAGVGQEQVKISSDPVVRSTGAAHSVVGSSPRSTAGPAVQYRECLKNHAASVGGHVVDGCGEYMPGKEADGLKCSVCGCHRSFHRKEMEGATLSSVPPSYYFHIYSNLHLANGGGHRSNGISPPPLLALPPPQSRTDPHAYNPTPMAAIATRRGGGNDYSGGGGGTTTESSSEGQDGRTTVAAVSRHRHGQGQVFGTVAPLSMLSRKRFRTKFTEEQKKRMLGFAEAMGWRMHRNEAAVERFCAEIGVSRQVFKVWMHNNKRVSSSPTSFKRPQEQQQLVQQHEQTHAEERKTEAREQQV